MRGTGRDHGPRCRRALRARQGSVLAGTARPRPLRRRAVQRRSPTGIRRRTYAVTQGVAAGGPRRAVRAWRPRSRRIAQAGELTADPARFGTIFGTGVGGIHTLEEQEHVRAGKGRAARLAVPRADDDGQRRRARRCRCDTDSRARARRSAPRAQPAPTRSAYAARLIAWASCDAVVYRRHRDVPERSPQSPASAT